MQRILWDWHDLRHPPLYFIILHFFLYLGNNDFLVRLPSVIFGVLAILFIYKIGSMFFGAREGLISALLLSISTMHIDYSQQALMYSLSAFISLLSIFLFYKAIKENGRKLLWFVVSMVLNVYTHYYLLFVPLFLLLFFVFILVKNRKSFIMNARKVGRKKIFVLILSLATISVFFLPLSQTVLSLFRTGKAIKVPWGLKPESFFIDVFSYFSVGYQYVPSRSYLSLSLYMFLLTFLFGLFTSIKEYKEPAILLLLWVFLPITVVFILSFYFGSPVATAHYMIFILPGYLVGVSRGISSIANVLSKCCYKIIHGLSSIPLSVISSSIALVIILIFAGLSTIPLQRYYSLERNNWRAAGEYLEANSYSGDVIIVEPKWNLRCILFYYDAYLKKTTVMSTEGSLVKIKDICSKYDRVWFVLDPTAITQQQISTEIGDWVHHNFIEVNRWGEGIFIFYRTKELTFISTKEMDFVGLDSPLGEPVAKFYHNDDSATFNVNISKAANYTIVIHAKSWIKSALELVIGGASKGTKTFVADDWRWVEFGTFYLDSGLHEIKIINREGGDLGDTNVIFDQVAIWPKQ